MKFDAAQAPPSAAPGACRATRNAGAFLALAALAGAAQGCDPDLRAPADPHLPPLATGFAVVVPLPADALQNPAAGAAPARRWPDGPAAAPSASPVRPPAASRTPPRAEPAKPPQFEAPATL